MDPVNKELTKEEEDFAENLFNPKGTTNVVLPRRTRGSIAGLKSEDLWIEEPIKPLSKEEEAFADNLFHPKGTSGVVLPKRSGSTRTSVDMGSSIGSDDREEPCFEAPRSSGVILPPRRGAIS